jgi:hypothetical protein
LNYGQLRQIKEKLWQNPGSDGRTGDIDDVQPFTCKKTAIYRAV